MVGGLFVNGWILWRQPLTVKRPLAYFYPISNAKGWPIFRPDKL